LASINDGESTAADAMTDAAQHLITMRKEDWLKLATPASICLLAASIFSIPLLTNAQITQNGSTFDPVHIVCDSGCN
tara:strand:+ start:214 stop:444 length:231 start_codon:yes stop_codon:yes gene_type:complete